MSMADVQALAARASSIHVRLGGEDQSVTLKEGVRWPLEQLALGRTFDRRLDGYAVTEATVAATWIGAAAPAMVTVGDSEAKQRSLSDVDFYHASGNPHGLHISEAGAMLAGLPTAIEVWLGGARASVEAAEAAADAAEADAAQQQQEEHRQPTTPLSRPATLDEIASANPKREQLLLSEQPPLSTTVTDTKSERMLQVAVPQWKE